MGPHQLIYRDDLFIVGKSHIVDHLGQQVSLHSFEGGPCHQDEALAVGVEAREPRGHLQCIATQYGRLLVLYTDDTSDHLFPDNCHVDFQLASVHAHHGKWPDEGLHHMGELLLNGKSSFTCPVLMGGLWEMRIPTANYLTNIKAEQRAPGILQRLSNQLHKRLRDAELRTEVHGNLVKGCVFVPQLNDEDGCRAADQLVAHTIQLSSSIIQVCIHLAKGLRTRWWWWGRRIRNAHPPEEVLQRLHMILCFGLPKGAYGFIWGSEVLLAAPHTASSRTDGASNVGPLGRHANRVWCNSCWNI
mmetsp:Transcript_139603/g.242942  ORF Transcript_139603/g.242942 Transcript_139603/m.242942 type:complete len:302 (+) Transcript_139603:228-1133(+)